MEIHVDAVGCWNVRLLLGKLLFPPFFQLNLLCEAQGSTRYMSHHFRKISELRCYESLMFRFGNAFQE